MLNWSEEYATGSKLVDLQHQRLIETINLLETLLNGPQQQATCDRLIDFLVRYVNTHFKLEEICMESHRCPAHAQNKREHAAFLTIVSSFEQRYRKEGPTLELLSQLHRVASEWIVQHILTVDIQLKGCMGTHQTQPAPHSTGKSGSSPALPNEVHHLVAV